MLSDLSIILDVDDPRVGLEQAESKHLLMVTDVSTPLRVEQLKLA
jgi:hypothetical protein